MLVSSLHNLAGFVQQIKSDALKHTEILRQRWKWNGLKWYATPALLNSA